MNGVCDRELLIQRTSSEETHKNDSNVCGGCNKKALHLTVFILIILSFGIYTTIFVSFSQRDIVEKNLCTMCPIQNITNASSYKFCLIGDFSFQKIFKCPYTLLGIGMILSGLLATGIILSNIAYCGCDVLCINLGKRPCCQFTARYISLILHIITLCVILTFIALLVAFTMTKSGTDLKDAEKFYLTGNIICTCKNHYLWFVFLVGGALFNTTSTVLTGLIVCQTKRSSGFHEHLEDSTIVYHSVNFSDF